mgnify:CR=1 FL=1|tara:strand:+ start:3119 stop:3577 length:459 start_codon:yes stop_codon:yes gene_type:complete
MGPSELSIAAKLITLFRKGYMNIKKEQIKKLEDRNVTDVTPAKIQAELNSVSKVSSKIIASNYENIKVSWDITFIDIVEFKRFGAKCMIFAKVDNPHVYSSIFMDVYFDDYPEIKILKANAKLRVTGIITKIEGSSIYLKPLKIEKDTFFVL